MGNRTATLSSGAVSLARGTVRFGLGARKKSEIKVRQPLGEAIIVADDREREAMERLGRRRAR